MATKILSGNLIKTAHTKQKWTEEELKHLAKCQSAKTGPKYFINNFFYIQHPTRGKIRYKAYQYQNELLKSFTDHRFSINMVSRQMGKALALDTPILTPDGFKPLGALKTGDEIYGRDGKPTKITFITEVMVNRPCYEMHFSTGEKITADAEHLWNVTFSGQSKEKTVNTLELLDAFKNKIQFTITKSKALITADPVEYKDQFQEGIRIVNTANEEIPVDRILKMSIASRLELIRGIISNSNASDNRYTLQHSNLKLLDSIQFLCSTAGIQYSRLSPSAIGFDIISPSDLKTLSSFKKAVLVSSKEKITLFNIIPSASVPVRCLQVDNTDHMFLCGHTLIPTHNTTTAVGYLLWYAMFKENSTILIAAHKYTGAQEIMQRLRYAYETCPDFIRAGVTSYNKQSIEFDNGSRIVAQTTTETTGRGMSVSLLYCDEFAHLDPNIANGFWTSISPTLSTGGKAIITSTPNSDEDQFAMIWKEANNRFDEYGNETQVGRNGFYAYKAIWSAHPDRDEAWANTERSRMSPAEFRREHLCEFLVFEETLIDSQVLADLSGVEPIMKMGQARWYKKIDPHGIYVISLDPSLGTGGDYAAIQVLELPTFAQVCEWHHNATPVQAQARILRDISKFIDNECQRAGVTPSIYYSVENNTVGESALVAINELGEDTFPGLFLSEPIKKGHSRRFRKGFNTTHSAKISACAKLKQLVETKQLRISSKSLISELKTYVANGITFKAKSGQHDDLISSVLLAIRMALLLQDWDPVIYDKMRDQTGLEEHDLPLPIYISR